MVQDPFLGQIIPPPHCSPLDLDRLGFDNSMTNGLQSINAFMNHFGNPTGSRLGFFGASMSVGGIAACLVAGFLVDRFGRRPICSAGAALVAAMAIMETFSASFEMFTGGKVLLGFGAFLQQVAAPVLVTKLAHPKQRVTISSLYNTSIFIRLIIGSWITFGTIKLESMWSWKLPCILQVAIPAYQTVMIWLVPESPRWLVSKGRTEEARQTLIKYHGNGVKDEIVKFELQEIIAGVEADRTVMKFSWEAVKTTVGSKGNRYRLWLCMWTAVGSQTIGGGFTASYLPIILDQIGMTSETEQTLINACINIFNWVCAFIAAFVIPRVGRRSIFLFSTIGTNVTLLIWTILSERYLATQKVGLGISVLVMIFSVTTKQRGVYFAITMFTINITAFFTTYVTPIGLENIGWRYYLPTCV
ncbi:general substrate transporter [Aspergillus keveii]|uniref:General substrate transporter n=1 Tax=Aspergillus keveii TaxID=714993 RepID=A0ABR4FZQ2_9EURO